MLIKRLIFYSQRIRELLAYTIMPDHVHLIVDIENVKDLSAFLRDYKKQTAKDVKTMLAINNPYIWQRGTMDHCIRFTWKNKDLQRHLEYVYFNSWKHLKIVPREFPYHNFRQAVDRGWIDEDFCSFNETLLQHRDIYE